MEKITKENLLLCNGGGIGLYTASHILISIISLVSTIRRTIRR